MIEFIIFLIIFLSVSVTATICAWGWLKADNKNADLLFGKEMYEKVVHSQRLEIAQLKAEISFLRNQLEEKNEKAD